MQVSKIHIRNILGIEDLEFAPGGFTAVKGRNGTGKTSVLEAVKAALSGGHDATLIRNGSEEGEVVLVLDDGTEITKRIKPTGSTVKVRGADGVEKSSPATRIKNLVDALSVNPVEFLEAPKAKRAAALLEAMPLQADAERIKTICGVAVDADGRHALEVITEARKAVFDDRTGTNRAAKEKRATASQLRLALPTETESGMSLPKLEEQQEAINAEHQAELLRIQNKLDEKGAEAAEQIEALRAQINEVEQKIHAIKDTQADNALKAAGARSRADAKRAEAIQQIASQLATAREMAKAEERAIGTREAITKLDEEVTKLEADSAKQSTAIEALDAYRLELVENLPIKGLTIEDGEILLGGVPLDRLNTAKQVEVAVEVAKLRAGKLPLVCVDGIERLDGDAYEAFKAAASKTGIQFVVTRVADEEFGMEVTE